MQAVGTHSEPHIKQFVTMDINVMSQITLLCGDAVDKNVALDKFVRYATSRYDKTHDAEHGWTVWGNAKNIIDHGFFPEASTSGFWRDVVRLCTVTHDVPDYKYVEMGLSIPFAEIKEFVDAYLGPGYWDAYLWVVTNVSWSKRNKQDPMPADIDPLWNNVRLIVQDADWLEALGFIGLDRCIGYIREYNPNKGKYTIEEETKLYISNKLRLIPDALHTESAKTAALLLMSPLDDYYNTH